MAEQKLYGETLAERAAQQTNLMPFEVQQLGAWLLQVMAGLIFVDEDPVVDWELRSLAQDAFYTGKLQQTDQKTLGLWVERKLDAIRSRDRRSVNSEPRPVGTRAMDRPHYSPIFAVHVSELDSYFGLSEHFRSSGCEHEVVPAGDCRHPTCRGRRAHIAWESIRNY